jgi:uncharacterized membrane protein
MSNFAIEFVYIIILQFISFKFNPSREWMSSSIAIFSLGIVVSIVTPSITEVLFQDTRPVVVAALCTVAIIVFYCILLWWEDVRSYLSRK